MQTRRQSPEVADAILNGESVGRLVALVDGAAKREAARERWLDEYRSEAEANDRHVPGWALETPKPEVRWRGRIRYGEGYFNRIAEWDRQWSTITPSQRALAASRSVNAERGGCRWSSDRWRDTTAAEAANDYDCSIRLVRMAIKLRRLEGRRRVLLSAVAQGSVGLADALEHADQSTPELRKAIKAVEQHKARSIRQALNR